MNKFCYIAGRIGDMPKEEYEPLFEAASDEVKAMGLIPVSPLEIKHDHERTWYAYMRADIQALMACGHIYAMRNWIHSNGAKIEVDIACKVGINVIFQPQTPNSNI